MFTWIWVFLLYSLKIETLFLKLEDQKLQTMQLLTQCHFFHSHDVNFPKFSVNLKLIKDSS